MELKNVAAIVTGGAQGLGLATAQALAKAGAKVAILDLNEAAAQAAAKEFGGIGVKCDVADGPSAEAAVAAAAAAHGPARVLVHCAGIATGAKIVSKGVPMPLDAFRRVIEINLIGTFNLVRLVAAGASPLEPLPTGERGVIITTSSIAAVEGQIGQTAYSASKAGVIGIMLPAARELAAVGIRVCVIQPGLFETPMVAGLPANVQDSLIATFPFPQRLGKAEEYAKLALAIIDNPMINGEVIRIDGALRMAGK